MASRYAGLKRIFTITGFDNVLNTCWQNELDKYRKQYSVGGELRSIVGMHVYGMNSVDELHEALSSNEGLRYSCLFPNGPPSRSQMSRDINSMDLEFVISVFHQLKQDAQRLGVYKETGYSEVMQKIDTLSNYLLVALDASLVVLNKGLFPFLKTGYYTPTGKQEYGLHIHVGHCINADSTTALRITDANIHETNEFERLVTQTIQTCKTTKLILVIDKGYYDHVRFQRLYDAKIFFVTPRKKYSLKKAILYLDEDRETIIDGKRIVDGYITINEMTARLRWIRVYEDDKKPFEILTNITSLPSEIIVALYGERWPIELVFKDVKQNFGLQQPIGRTMTALVFHIYAVFIAYLLLQIFRHILGGRYTGMSMLIFRRSILYSDDLEMILRKPP
ncbi:MAG: IS4 family transposase [Thermoplasmata archaeon]|nr:IS4 family transposase [Thermoplasmata archaeon]